MKKTQLISLISLISVNVFCLFALSVAWFTASQNINNGANNITAVNGEILDSVHFYPYRTNDPNEKGTYYFDTEEISSKDLGYYSINNSGYQVLVEVDLIGHQYGEKNSVIFESTTSAETYLGNVTRNTDGTMNNELKVFNNSLTSIVCFYAFTEDQVTTSDDGSYFAVTTSNCASGKTSFIKDDYSGLKDSDTIRIYDFKSVSRFFFVIDYDEESIETIYSANLGNDVTSGFGDDMVQDADGTTYVSYTADFTFSIVKTGDD